MTLLTTRRNFHGSLTTHMKNIWYVLPDLPNMVIAQLTSVSTLTGQRRSCHQPRIEGTSEFHRTFLLNLPIGSSRSSPLSRLSDLQIRQRDFSVRLPYPLPNPPRLLHVFLCRTYTSFTHAHAKMSHAHLTHTHTHLSHAYLTHTHSVHVFVLSPQDGLVRRLPAPRRRSDGGAAARRRVAT